MRLMAHVKSAYPPNLTLGLRTTSRQIDAHDSHTNRNTHSEIHLHKKNAHASRAQARVPFAPRASGTLTCTPSTATVCGRMNNLTSVRQRNEREEGGREGGCSQPELTPCYGKCRSLEQTKQHSSAARRHDTRTELY